MRSFSVMILYLMSFGVVPAQEKPEPLIIANVRSRLISTGIAEYITIIKVTQRGDCVYAVANPGVDLLQVLKSNAQFGKDMFKSGIAHKGCNYSMRQKINPSLQITFVRNKNGTELLELDIDEQAPWFNHPIAALRHTVVAIRNHIEFKFGKNPKTNQEKIAKKIASKQQVALKKE